MNIFKLNTCECACPICVDMCKHTPCWGTPEEIFNMLPEYKDSLVLLKSINGTYVVCPTIKGVPHKSHFGRDFFEGECIFLKESKCSIHSIKPIEGRIANHNVSYWDVRLDLEYMWESEDGRCVLELFKELISNDLT